MRLKLIKFSGILFIIIIANTLFAQHKDFTKGIKVTIPMTSGLESPSFIIDDREDILVLKHKISELEEIAKPSQLEGAWLDWPTFSFETRGVPGLPDYGSLYADNDNVSHNVVELIFIDNNKEVSKYFHDRNNNLKLWFINKTKEHIQEIEELREYVEPRLNYIKSFEMGENEYGDTTNGLDGNTSDKQGSDNGSPPQFNDKKKLKDLVDGPDTKDGHSNELIKKFSPKYKSEQNESESRLHWYILVATLVIIVLLTIILHRRRTNR